MANTQSEAKSFAHTADVSTMSHLLLEIMENKPLFAEIQRLEFSRKFYEHHRDWWVHLYPLGRLCQKILDLRDSGTGTEAHKRMLDNDLQQGREELREAWKTLREHWAAQKNEKRISLGVYNALDDLFTFAEGETKGMLDAAAGVLNEPVSRGIRYFIKNFAFKEA